MAQTAQIIVDGKAFPMPDDFTFREVDLIKRISGLRPLELEEAYKAGDAALRAALAVIAMRRAGHDVTEDFILDMKIGDVTEREGGQDGDDPPADAGEPARAPRKSRANGGAPR